MRVVLSLAVLLVVASVAEAQPFARQTCSSGTCGAATVVPTGATSSFGLSISERIDYRAEQAWGAIPRRTFDVRSGGIRAVLGTPVRLLKSVVARPRGRGCN